MDDNTVLIPLSGKHGQGKFAIVDADDAESISRYRWHSNHGYAQTFISNPAAGLGKQRRLLMHRLIMTPPVGLKVDHINGDRLDNRRSNLRTVTDAQNAQNAARRKDNSSGFKGVRFHKATEKWQVSIRKNGVSHYLGVYETPEQAAEVYRKAAERLHGDYARKAV